MTSTRAYDMLNRLTNVSNNAAGSLSSSYGYNAANQRTNQLREDGAYWVYQYDSLGQVTNGNKYFSDGTLAPGGQFDYQFDTIGNRTQTMTGGDTNGANLRAANYAANDLNELTNRDVPGFIEVQGSANSNATVTVNGTAAYRHLDYYRAELGVNNAAAPVYQAVTNQGALSPDAATLTANALVAATSETFIYDADGNLLSDGKWNYTWDGENRLTALESLGTVPSQARSRLEFAYDGGGRRIFKRVKVWDAGSGAYQVADEQRYWYDGWNLIGRTSRAAQEVQVYAWGLDLSGSLQGAGGVGGLLWLNDSSATNAQTSTSFYAFDGNGNVLGLISGIDGTLAAQYEYAPFGELVRETGPLARNNPFRFSTKYQDDESDLLYYGYRYYNASTGRWPNRDPLQEYAGFNINEFALNNPISIIDLLGMDDSRWDIHNEDLPDSYGITLTIAGRDPHGFSIKYSPAPGECKDGKIVLYQTINQNKKGMFGFAESPHVDVGSSDINSASKQKAATGCPLPPYVVLTRASQEPALTYLDSPTTRALYNVTYDITAVAVCRSDCTEKVLSVFYFEFDNQKREITVKREGDRSQYDAAMKIWDSN